MITNRKPQTKKKKSYAGVKYVLSSLSLISVIGLWQHFANNDALKSATAAANDANQSNNLIQFQPLPTLMSVQTYQQGSAIQTMGNTAASPLREVTAPTAHPKTQPRITLNHVTINNSGSGSAFSPLTRSGSSR